MPILKTTTFYESIEDEFYSSLTSIDLELLGQEQWKQLDELAYSYAQKPMSQFYKKTKFNDDIWWLTERKSINWNKYRSINSNNFPFILLVKIMVYFNIQVVKKNRALFYGNISRLVSFIGSRMANEGILTANRYEPFKPGSIVTTTKLHQWIVEAVDNKEFRGPTPLEMLEKLIRIPESQFNGIPFLRVSCESPWEGYKNITTSSLDDIRYFFKQRYLNDILGECATRTSVKSYQAFSENVCAKILDFSTLIVYEYKELLKEIFDITKFKDNLTSRDMLNKRASDVIFKYKGELDNILPIRTFERKERAPVVRVAYLNELYEVVQGAALWIIFLTTAIRNEDICKNLLKECYEPDPDSELMNYLIIDIKKTKQEDYPIPIPPVTVEAVKLLQSLNYAPEGCSNLVVRRNFDGSSNTKNWFYDGASINRLLRHVGKVVGVNLLDGLEENDNEEGMAHRCRATMAGWIGTNSPIAVMIVRRLFGHTNGVMPDHYLKANKAVQETRRELRNKTYTDLSDSISESIVDEKIGGGMKRIITDSRDHLERLIKDDAAKNNESLTEGEIRLRLMKRIAHILKQRLLHGEILGLQTPLSFVCMRPTASGVDAPCAINTNKLTRLNKEIDNSFAKGIQLTGLPEFDNCKGPSCQHSLLFDNPVTKILLEQFKYYATYLQGIKHTEIDLDKEAENFINLYYEPLNDVYPQVMEEIKGEAPEGILND